MNLSKFQYNNNSHILFNIAMFISQIIRVLNYKFKFNKTYISIIKLDVEPHPIYEIHSQIKCN